MSGRPIVLVTEFPLLDVARGGMHGHRTVEAGSVEHCTKGNGPDTGYGIDGEGRHRKRPPGARMS